MIRSLDHLQSDAMHFGSNAARSHMVYREAADCDNDGLSSLPHATLFFNIRAVLAADRRTLHNSTLSSRPVGFSPFKNGSPILALVRSSPTIYTGQKLAVTHLQRFQRLVGRTHDSLPQIIEAMIDMHQRIMLTVRWGSISAYNLGAPVSHWQCI